jgi:GntR family transcriptional regulator/MocR family aminotransferase
MAHTRAYIDRQGDHTMERALATMFEDGEFGAHVRRMHRTYEKRREVLFSVLEKELGDVLSFERPSGGLAVWTRIECPVSAQAWAERAAERGVIVQAAQRFFLDGRDRRFFRVGYARLNEDEIVRAVRLLARSRPRTPTKTTLRRS